MADLHLHRPVLCPACAATLNVSLHVGKQEPAPGDATLCSYCLSVLVFNEDFSVHVPTPAEIEALPDDILKRLSACKQALRTLKRLRGIVGPPPGDLGGVKH